MRLGSALRRRQTHGAASAPMATGECGVRREGGRPVPQRPNPNRARAAARPIRAARRRTLLPLARGIRGRGRIGRHRRVHGRDLRPSGRDRHDGGQQGDENSDEDEALHDRALSFRTGPATPGNGRGTAGADDRSLPQPESDRSGTHRCRARIRASAAAAWAARVSRRQMVASSGMTEAHQ